MIRGCLRKIFLGFILFCLVGMTLAMVSTVLTPRRIAPTVAALPTVAGLPSETAVAAAATDIAPAATATITDTSAPAATETYQDAAERIVRENLTDEIIAIEANETTPAVIVQYRMPQSLQGYDIEVTEKGMARLGCALRTSARFIGWRYLFRAAVQTRDAANTVSDAKGLNVLLSEDAVRIMNCIDPDTIPIKEIAETYDLNPLLQSGETAAQAAPPPAATSSGLNVLNTTPETYYAGTGGANLRSCPETSCSRVGSIGSGEGVTVNGMVDGDAVDTGNKIWYRVTFGGTEAFVYSGLMYLNRPVTSSTGSNTSSSPATSGGQSSAPAGNTFTCPSNCTEAVALGVSAQQAAQCGLDRDGDGVACYGD